MSKKPIAAPPRSLSERAVDGLFAGLAGGAVMLGYLTLATLVVGGSVQEVLASLLNGDGQPVSTLWLHFSVASVYGLFFGVLWRGGRLTGRASWLLVGLGYGLLLWLIAQMLIPQTGQVAPLPPLHLLLAHLLYGATAAAVLQPLRAS